ALVQVSAVAVASGGRDRTARKSRAGSQEAVVTTHFGVATQRAPLGLRADVGVQLEPGEGGVARPAGRVRDLEPVAAAELQAGFGARDVEEAGAVYVADADVFDRLRLGHDDRVGGACGTRRHGHQGRGADEKALDVHSLTSSQAGGRLNPTSAATGRDGTIP